MGDELLSVGAPRLPLVYGPFARRGAPLEGRLARLDAALRAHDPALGVREVEALLEAGRSHGLALAEDRAMPEEGDRLLVLRTPG